MSENVWIGFLCLHGFRGLLFLDRLGLVGADAYEALELLHEDEHQDSVRTIEQSCQFVAFGAFGKILTQVSAMRATILS